MRRKILTIHLFLTLTAILICALSIGAQVTSKKFPNIDNLNNLCSLIDDRTKDPDKESDFLYLYQRRVSEAAGVGADDEPEQVRKKVGLLFNQYGNKLTCSNTRFDVTNGSVIKFAASSQFARFLEDVIYTWQLDLNVVDPADGKTLLDYVEQQADLNKGAANEAEFRRYVKILRNAGAKRKSEL